MFLPWHPWVWPSRPWARLHCDYAGPFLGHRFLVVINAYSQVAGSMPNNFNDINSYCGKTVGSFCTVRIARDLGH